MTAAPVTFYVENNNAEDFDDWWRRARETGSPRMYVGKERRMCEDEEGHFCGVFREVTISLSPVINAPIDEHCRATGCDYTDNTLDYFLLMGRCMALVNEYLAVPFWTNHLKMTLSDIDSPHLEIQESISYGTQEEMRERLWDIATACGLLTEPLQELVTHYLPTLTLKKLPPLELRDVPHVVLAKEVTH